MSDSYILFRVSTFAKPECDNVFQPDPRSDEGCNALLTIITRGLLQTLIHGKECSVYRHRYITFGPFQTTATFQRLHHLSCLCKSGNLCTEADLLKYCYLLR